MTKPIIVVKVPCKLLYVIQVKEFLIKCSTSWPYLISEFLVAYITIMASDWPRTFLHPRCFCLTKFYSEILVTIFSFTFTIPLFWFDSDTKTMPVYYIIISVLLYIAIFL